MIGPNSNSCAFPARANWPKPSAMALIETAKLNGLDPQVYLADVLDRIHDHKINKLDELLPWNWKALPQEAGNQAA